MNIGKYSLGWSDEIVETVIDLDAPIHTTLPLTCGHAITIQMEEDLGAIFNFYTIYGNEICTIHLRYALPLKPLTGVVPKLFNGSLHSLHKGTEVLPLSLLTKDTGFLVARHGF